MPAPPASVRRTLVACLVALPVFLVCAFAQTRVGAPAPGELPATWPAVIGDRIVHGEAEARFRLQGAPPFSQVPFEAAGQRGTLHVVPKYSPFHHVVTFATGLLFWATCMFVFAPRSEGEPARTFLWACLFYGLAIMAGDVHFPGTPTWPNAFFPLARMFAILATPVLFVRMAFNFPRPDRRLPGDLIVSVLALLAGLLFAVQAGCLLLYVAHGTAEGFARFVFAGRVAIAFVAVLALAGAVYLSRSTSRAVLARERSQVKWVAWGTIVGGMPFILFHALPLAFGQRPLATIDLLRLCAGSLPVSYGIAVARHQFLNIDVIIRRSLIYGAMAALLTVLYLAVGLVLAPSAFPLGMGEWILILSTGTAVALFRPTRRLLGRWVDRSFFQLRAGYGREAEALRGTLARCADPEVVTTELERTVKGALAPERVRIVTAEEPADAVAVAATQLVAASPLVLTALSETTAQPEHERTDWPAELGSAGYVLVQPLVADGGPQGALLLGPRESGRRYIEEDLEFLATVAGHAGRTLERVLLERRAAEESFLRARQSELDRQKSVFLSRVAHDLRTPLTSILWSSRNVLDGIRGPVTPGVVEDVGSMHASAALLGRLVENLLDVARLGSDGAVPPLEPVDACAIVEEARRTLEPIARTREVRLVAAIGPGVRAVRARRDGLSRVAVNLVENAIKFSPPGAQVEIALDADADGGVILAVSDHGPGVTAEDRPYVFQLYRQGRAGSAGRAGSPGIGVGFGVGLSVVKQWVERFGGSIAIEETPGGGARFVCRLRAWAPKEGGVAWPAS